LNNIFIIGAGSQDGRILSKKYEKKYFIIKFYRNSYIIGNKKNKINLKNKHAFKLLLIKYKPKEIYYFLVYQTNSLERIKNNFTNLNNYLEINFYAFYNLLEAVRLYSPKSKIFYASSSFIFNGYKSKKVNEETIPFPICPYGFSKFLSMELCEYYRKIYKLYIVVGILFNHDSEYRSHQFFIPTLIRRIVNCKKNMLEIKKGYRDWSYAEDIVNAIILTMKQKKSSIYIINSGQLISTIQIAKKACILLNKKINIKNIPNQNDDLRIKGNNSKLLSLGFKNNYSVEDIILKIFQSLINV